MALTKVTFSMISGSCANVVDYGADSTGTTDSKTAIDLAIASGAESVFFPANGTYKYVGTLVLPNRPVRFFGESTRNPNGPRTILNIQPTGQNAIEAVLAVSPKSRFSIFSGLHIQAGNTKTAFYIDNGGVSIEDCFVETADIALHLRNSWHGTYTNSVFQGASTGIFLDVTTSGYLSVNTFLNCGVNCVPTGVAAPVVGSVGVRLENDESGILAGNCFINCGHEYGDIGVKVTGTSLNNTWVCPWFEVNTDRDVYYDGVGTQQDTWIEPHYSNPAPASPTVFGNQINTVANGIIKTAGLRLMDAGTSADPNTLKDYKEGSWSMGWMGSVSNPTQSGGVVTGFYTKIGNMVTVHGQFYRATVSGGSGNLRIGPLPYTSESSSSNYAAVQISSASSFLTLGPTGGIVSPNADYIELTHSDGLTASNLTTANVQANSSIVFSVTYAAA